MHLVLDRRSGGEEVEVEHEIDELFELADAEGIGHNLTTAVLDIADEIAAKSPLAIWGSKEMLNYSRDHSVEDGLNFIATWQTGMFQPADMMETFSAKADKRDPEFDDLLPSLETASARRRR